MISRTLALLFALSTIILGFLYAQESKRKPMEVIREIEKRVEVPREVVREVKVDRVVEVPREIVKEVPVEVVRMVEKPLTEAQTSAIDLAARVVSAEFVYKKEDILAGTKSVRVRVSVSEDLKRVIGEEVVKNRVELVLRRNGVKIDPEASGGAFVQFEGFWDKEELQMTYSMHYGVDGVVYLARGGKFRTFIADLWEEGTFGYAGKNKIRDAVLRNSESAGEALANALLKARDQE